MPGRCSAIGTDAGDAKVAHAANDLTGSDASRQKNETVSETRDVLQAVVCAIPGAGKLLPALAGDKLASKFRADRIRRSYWQREAVPTL